MMLKEKLKTQCRIEITIDARLNLTENHSYLMDDKYVKFVKDLKALLNDNLDIVKSVEAYNDTTD